MTGEPRVQRIAPDELPELLTRLKDERTAKLALIGPTIKLSASSLPEKLREGVVYKLSGVLSELPCELLRLDYLQTLTLWRLGLKDEDVIKIAENLEHLTALDLSANKLSDVSLQTICKHFRKLKMLDLGNEVERSSLSWIVCSEGNHFSETSMLMLAEHLGQLTALDLSNNNLGIAGVQALAVKLAQLTTLNLKINKM